MKLKTYKLRDLSYLGLNLNYLALIAATIVITIVVAAMASSSGNWVWLIFSLIIGGGVTFYIYHVGVKYGQYGLIISMAKIFQPKHIKNDFPLFAKNLVVKK